MQKLDIKQLEDEKVMLLDYCSVWYGFDSWNKNQITTKPRNVHKGNEKNKHGN